MFYYSLLGPGGAFAYRAINTLDSMVGYKDDYYKDIGWMSARLDTLANYVPALHFSRVACSCPSPRE